MIFYFSGTGNSLSAAEKLLLPGEQLVSMATVNQIESFSPPIFASWCSKNGEICIDRLTRYKKLIGPMRFLVTKEEDKEIIHLVPGDEDLEVSSFLVQSEFAFLIGMIRRATHEDIDPLEIRMVKLPEDDSFVKFAGVAPKRGDENSISFSRKDLNEPFISFNDAMWSYFEPELAKRLAEVDVDDSVSARVRSALTELLPGGRRDHRGRGGEVGPLPPDTPAEAVAGEHDFSEAAEQHEGDTGHPLHQEHGHDHQRHGLSAGVRGAELFPQGVFGLDGEEHH